MSRVVLIHYCGWSYQLGHFGGVAHYDYQLQIAFPNRVFIKGPDEKTKLNLFLKKNPNAIVVTDNHLACDVPTDTTCFIVHHGIAKTHAEREPGWGKEGVTKLCVEGQDKMLNHRRSDNTYIISPAYFCTSEFTRHMKENYTRLISFHIPHATLNAGCKNYKRTFNRIPIVTGNWASPHKGSHIIKQLASSNSGFIFKPFVVRPAASGDQNFLGFASRKLDEYLKCDIFLQLSVHEGNSYASLDALAAGLPVVATDVGAFWQDVPEDCFIKIRWEDRENLEIVHQALKKAWERRSELSRKGYEYCAKYYNLNTWAQSMKSAFNYAVSQNRNTVQKTSGANQ